MPGPVSDSFDPEFGTGDAAHRVASALKDISSRIGAALGERKNIVEIVDGDAGHTVGIRFCERDMRLIRFGVERALESI